MTQEFDASEDGVRVNDKRRIDPDTYEVRQTSSGEPQSQTDTDRMDADQMDAAQMEHEAAVIEGEVGGIEEKVAELTSDLQRVHAEYANYRKRVDRDREVNRQIAMGSVFIELLPILDDIDRAREHGELTGAFKTMGESLEASVSKLGLEKFGSANEPFDPNMHEALASEEVEGVTEPTVIAVFQPGYRQGERILRPARVSVAGT
ncbi:MAG: nucleotide exchange factor GrpE [Candidatus Nanopelagicales bacterium]|nr:nucleotide exchange factor GrpE [Candidatus Nanopelagicales bacterium]MCF8540026.1 nucleotide exchange factor GrpE [Candidatus Nanopelagicales bacterium]